MSKILEIDLSNRRMLVQPGIFNLDISTALSPLGYYYAPIPPVRRPAPWAATSPRTRAGLTASSTG